MFTYFSSKLQVSSKIVKTNETCALVATSAEILVFDEGTESADIATNENILLCDDWKVKLF
jgi:hypothetical protein